MSLKNIELGPSYGGVSENLIDNFYRPCIESSVSYKRSTAYFTGGVYSLASVAYKKFFIENKGTIEVVTSPFFDSKIKDSFDEYYKIMQDEELSISLLEDSLTRLGKDDKGQELIQLISLLMNLNKLKIKIALVPDPGIHHEKIGIFEDSHGHSVSFSGSINETWAGWTKNYEEFKVFNNWDLSSKYWNIDTLSFEDLWANRKKNVEVIDLPVAIENNLLKVVKNSSLDKLEAKIEILNQIVDETPKKPSRSLESIEESANTNKKTLMLHQKQVLDSWEDNDRFGLVVHATGSGKTITGIQGIKTWLDVQNVVLVIVPSIILLEQWLEEIENEIDEVNVFLTGGEVPKSVWLKSLKFLSAPNTNEKIIIISTLATASSKDFIDTFKWGNHVMMVVDEVHRIGSKNSSNLLSNSIVGSALGLSATPERFGDEEGTKKIYDFFKNVLKPQFSLEDAISVGRLVPYEYFPETVELNIKEQELYDEFTEKIVYTFHILQNDINNIQLQNQFKRLLIQRAKVLKQAENKADLALKILLENYAEGEHWLVYCDDTNQLNQVVEILSKNNIRTLKYTSSMDSDRSQTLDLFKYKAGVLVAIKCLDEGVDLPYLSNAIILASSKNPREHIQRRGRVLRKSEGKYFAKIYDAIVLPNSKSVDLENDSIMSGEIKRAISFANGANNASSRIYLLELGQKYNIEIENIKNKTLEEE